MVKNKDKKYKILHVEDFTTDAELAAHEIKKVLRNAEIKVVETEENFVLELDNFQPDIVVSDYMLPSFNGMKALKIVLQKAPRIPVIILTGSMNEDTAVDCMKAGAANYVIKEHIKRLGPAVISALEQKKIKEEKEKALEQIKLLSTAIEKSPLSILITDAEGIIEYVNTKFSELTGYSAEEIKGENPRILKSGEQKNEFYKNMWESIKAGNDWTGEMINKKNNGESYWANVSISSITNEKGKITHFVGIIEDISERKLIKAELLKHREHLEEMVKERTEELEKKNVELEEFNELFVGREFRIKELKDRVLELENKLAENKD